MHRRSFLQASAASLLAAGRVDRLIAAEPSLSVPPIGERMQSLKARRRWRCNSKARRPARREWQSQFATKLNELLGLDRPPEKWDCLLERRVELSAPRARRARAFGSSHCAGAPALAIAARRSQEVARDHRLARA